ncbi:MAG: DUF4465 domain-containing protein [Planctomycetales bacterium]|nr:DUF4465 domain-containing protein [Planctomycetales bacterium]
MKCIAINLLWIILVASGLSSGSFAGIVTFEDLTAFTGTSGNQDGQPGGQFYNGDAGNGTNSNGWSSGGALFSNTYDTSFGGFWTGWAYSNVVNPVTTGFSNQYAAAAGGGANGSGGVNAGQNYAIGFEGGTVNLPLGAILQSVEITNTTYARFSLENGDAFAKKFGGTTGDDPDFFRVSFTGYDSINGNGNPTTTVEVALADFTFADNTQDYIVTNWTSVDISSLAGSRSIGISFSSSDVGVFGVNTPTYVAIDNLSFSAVPEPSLLSWLSLCGTSALIWRSRKGVGP